MRRNEMSGGSLWLVGEPTPPSGLLPESEVARANGLVSQPLGSAGKLSRPATVKLLRFPPARAAQRWLTNDDASNGFCDSGTILPPAGALGD